MIVRAHELEDEGFKQHPHKSCYTIFSAPSYERGDNIGAVMSIYPGPCMDIT